MAKGIIAKLVQEYKADWDSFIPQVLMRLRSWNKLPFKMSPHKARTGVDMQLPSAFENPMHVSEAATTARWKEIDAIIVKARDEVASKYKEQYDKTHEHKEFKVGQRVWWREHVPDNSLAPKRTGPYLIKKVLSPLTYEVEELPQGPRIG